MGFGGGPADREPAGDLRIAQPLDEERKNFHFAAGQISSGRGFISFSLDQIFNGFLCQGRFSRKGRPDGIRQLFAGDVLQQVSRGASFQSLFSFR